MPFKTDFLEGLILLYSNQISNCLLKKLSFQDSCTPHVKRKKTLSIPAFLYMVSSVPTFGTRDTNAWYERYHPLKFVVPMPGTSPTKGGIKLIPVRHRIQKEVLCTLTKHRGLLTLFQVRLYSLAGFAAVFFDATFFAAGLATALAGTAFTSFSSQQLFPFPTFSALFPTLYEVLLFHPPDS